jgi:threonine/homoserine/homoserine lactone efflux protein
VAGWVAGQPDIFERYTRILPLMLAFAFFSNFTYALVGSMLRHWLAQGRRLLMFNRLMALTLVATSLWIVLGLRAAA